MKLLLSSLALLLLTGCSPSISVEEQAFLDYGDDLCFHMKRSPEPKGWTTLDYRAAIYRCHGWKEPERPQYERKHHEVCGGIMDQECTIKFLKEHNDYSCDGDLCCGGNSIGWYQCF